MKTLLFLLCILSTVSCSKKHIKNTSNTQFREYVRHAKINEIKLALNNGFNVNTLGYAQENALHEANDFEVVSVLLNAGIDVNNQALPKIDGRTALHLACMAENINLKIIKLLVKTGANVNLKDAKGNTAYDYAIKYQFFDKANFLQGVNKEKTTSTRARPKTKPAKDIAIEPIKIINVIVTNKGYADSSVKSPLEINNKAMAKDYFIAKDLYTIQTLDFNKVKVLVIAWWGSGQDKLTHNVLESHPEQIEFKFQRGKTRDLRQHQYVFILRKNVSWTVAK